MEFAVVKFTEENNVAVVPLTWIKSNHIGDFCYYPESSKDVTTLVKNKVKPTIDWKIFSISIMHEYATFHEARSKLRKAEDTSNLSSGEEDVPKKRKTKRPGFLLPGEEDTSEDENFSNRPEKKKKTKTIYPYPSFPSTPPFQAEAHHSKNAPELSTPRSGSHIHNENSLQSTPTRKSVSSCERCGVVLGQLQATVADMSQEIRGLHNKLDMLLQNYTPGINATSVDNEENFSLIGSLPLLEDGALDSFEQKLESAQSQNLLLKVLISVGGKDSKSMTYNCLRRCLSYAVAEKLSYSGVAAKDKAKTKKKCFKSTHLCKVIHAAVKRVHISTTDEEIKIFMCHWLQQAKSRIPKKVVPVDAEEVPAENELNNM